MQTSLRSQVTVICATYNRPHYIKRYIDYYADTGVSVIIEDSSDQPLTGVTIPDNIRYSWKPKRTFTQKVYEMIEQVKTPYITLCSDDDFTVPEAMETCIEWLNTHPDYSAAHGQQMRLVNKNGRNYYTLELRSEAYPGKHNAETTPLARLQKQFTPHAGFICGMVRTEYMRQAVEFCQRKLVKIDVFVLVLDITLAAAGKTIILPVLYNILSYIPNSSGTQSQHIVEYNPDRMTESQKQEFAELVAFATSAFRTYSSMSEKEIETVLISIFHALDKQGSEYHPLIQATPENAIKRFAKSLLPRSLYLLLGEAIKTQRLLRYLRSEPDTPYSNAAMREQLRTVSRFVEKHNHATSMQVADSKWQLFWRHLFIDRFFQA